MDPVTKFIAEIGEIIFAWNDTINFNKKYDWRSILPNGITTLLLFLFSATAAATADKYKNVVSFNNEESSVTAN